MYDRILVPTDGSEWAMAVTGPAFALARLSGATIHALSVIELEAFGSDDEQSVAEQAAQAAVNRVAHLGKEAGCEVQTSVWRGLPHEAIRQYVDDHRVDLVAMGTHGRTGLQRFLIGSVTERVLRESPVPVLTAHLEDGRDLPTYDRLLVPTDGSSGSLAALDHALAIAAEAGAAVHALSVVDVRAFTAGHHDTGTALAMIRKQLETYAEQAVDAIETEAKEVGVDVVPQVVTGLPADEICEYATDEDIDLIVMGTHGRTGLDRVLFGSVTERVVRTAGVPVLTVRPAA